LLLSTISIALQGSCSSNSLNAQQVVMVTTTVNQQQGKKEQHTKATMNSQWQHGDG